MGRGDGPISNCPAFHVAHIPDSETVALVITDLFSRVINRAGLSRGNLHRRCQSRTDINASHSDFLVFDYVIPYLGHLGQVFGSPRNASEGQSSK